DVSFFFSSRRRHTRSKRDWSSDVCSSDLHRTGYRGRQCITEFLDLTDEIKELILERKPPSEIRKRAVNAGMTSLRQAALEKLRRSEERRVGKECRKRWQ